MDTDHCWRFFVSFICGSKEQPYFDCHEFCDEPCNERLEYPTLYASGKAGFCARSLEEAQSESRPTDMVALYETIKDVVPPPEPATVAPGTPCGLLHSFCLVFICEKYSRWMVSLDCVITCHYCVICVQDPEILAVDEKNKGFSMLVSQLDRSALFIPVVFAPPSLLVVAMQFVSIPKVLLSRRLPALGPTVTGKIYSGQIHKGDKISCSSARVASDFVEKML